MDYYKTFFTFSLCSSSETYLTSYSSFVFQEDELRLLETSSSSSSTDNVIDVRPGTASQLGIPDAGPRRASASSVRVQRALFPLQLPHLTRVNSF